MQASNNNTKKSPEKHGITVNSTKYLKKNNSKHSETVTNYSKRKKGP
jgi:hypothetical protein